MNFFEAIKTENKEILRTVAQLEDSTAGEPENRIRLLENLRATIAEQSRVAEEYIYPIFTAAEKSKALVERARREVADIDSELDAVCHSAMDESKVKYQIEGLSSRVRTHLDHDADELLPEADRLLGDDEEKALIDVINQRHDRLSHKLRPH